MQATRVFVAFWLMLTAIAAVAAVPPQALAQLAQAEGERPPSLSPMLEEVLPSVVNISVRGMVEVEPHPLLRDPDLRRFFGLPEQNGERQFQAVGSGVVVDPKAGHLITNAHVIEEADEILVTFNTGEQVPAEIVGLDPATDLAVLRIEQHPEHPLQGLSWAEPGEVKVGDWVVAVGNPFGLNQSVTTGVVSAMGRTGLGIQGFEDFIQTDASINPGHSGGPLVNLHGQVVGINLAILAPGGGNIGIGFAIPAGIALMIADELIEHGTVERGQLGVMIQDLTPDLAKTLDTDAEQGAVIAEVLEGSPAAQAGIEAGDVVTAVNGENIENAGKLGNEVALRQVGDQLDLTLDRGGETLELKVAIGEADEAQPLQRQQPMPGPGAPGPQAPPGGAIPQG